VNKLNRQEGGLEGKMIYPPLLQAYEHSLNLFLKVS